MSKKKNSNIGLVVCTWQRMLHACLRTGLITSRGEMVSRPGVRAVHSKEQITLADTRDIHYHVIHFARCAKQENLVALFNCLCSDTKEFFGGTPSSAFNAISEIYPTMYVSHGVTTPGEIAPFGIGVECRTVTHVNMRSSAFSLYLIHENGHWRITTSDRISS